MLAGRGQLAKKVSVGTRRVEGPGECCIWGECRAAVGGKRKEGEGTGQDVRVSCVGWVHEAGGAPLMRAQRQQVLWWRVRVFS